jgi:hypothetical protein
MDKNNIFVGTKAEYEAVASTLPLGAVIILTDVQY